MISGISRIGEGITHQIERNGDQRNDHGGENQQMRKIQEVVTGIPEQQAQRGRVVIQTKAQIGDRKSVV